MASIAERARMELARVASALFPRAPAALLLASLPRDLLLLASTPRANPRSERAG
jgi:hypothetical protein|tara:strand:+ start:3524 stop:3685 length:162 start_codon:yes stop_codon:yes gene_type:complete